MAHVAYEAGRNYGDQFRTPGLRPDTSEMRSKFADTLYSHGYDLHGTAVKKKLWNEYQRGVRDAAAGKSRFNPSSAAQYRLAQAVLSGTARQTGMTRKAAQEIVEATPAYLRSEYMRSNPCEAPESSIEYRLGYNLGQMDRQNAALPKTARELLATFESNFGIDTVASSEQFAAGYQAGYGTASTSAPNPSRRNQASEETSEYEQARKIAELFHGRPVKEEITVTEQIREHDWLWRIGPLIALKIQTLTKRSATLPFAREGEGMVHLFCSPDGRQFYMRGGDQELDLKPLGMGPGTDWYRDHMLIGEAKEITYADKKKFHKFKLIDYFHKLGEMTKKKPMLAYDAFAKKLSIVGGQYKVETTDLVDGMSPGIVN